ncbi:MAG: hypothetical protein ACYCQJ_06045 [Nitrososphaerales archaeon]
MPKPKLEQLKGNVDAQESRLEEGIKMLSEARNKPRNSEQTLVNPEWDSLERVIGLMDDLINSYRAYTVELEKRVKWLGARAMSGKES